MTQSFDLILIGTGPAGYVCAIRAAQLGMNVAVVEKREAHGGTCLNVGCIPSKALLHSSELFESAQKDFPLLGIDTGNLTLNLDAMMQHRDRVIAANVQGIAALFKKNKITSFHGSARIVSEKRVEITPASGEKSLQIEGKHLVIATGSEPAALPGTPIDEKQILSSTGALFLESVPKKMAIIGAGVIGLELGSVWHRLGSEVTIIDIAEGILPGTDKQTAQQFQKILQKQGLQFLLSSTLNGITKKGGKAQLSITPSTGEPQTLEADVVLISVGRKPCTEGLGLQEMGIATDDRGRIQTDSQFRTNVSGIYAIGDVIAGPMLAHKASEEGVALAEILAGQAGHVSYDLIPSVIYTMPELASIGKTEEELKANGISYKVGKFPMTANARARAMLRTDGFVKILADTKTDRILGAHLIGAGAGDLIHEIAVTMEFSGSAEDLARVCHAHPTLSETIKEAALAAGTGAIHS